LLLYPANLIGGVKLLTDEDKEHIYQEEKYRLEVRAQLDKASPKVKTGEKIWTFINSTVFLWFLSSVVLGLISFSYARWDAKRTREREGREKSAFIEREKTETAKRIDGEITSRINYFVQSQLDFIHFGSLKK
jgi:hypothetical protein